MRKIIVLITTFILFTVGFSSCGDKCWRCKTWQMIGNGTLQYTGEDELCETKTKAIKELDYLENDSTDGWECEAFYK